MKTTTEPLVEIPADRRMKNPSHPGEFIRDVILASHELTVVDAARALGVGRPALSNLLNGHADLSGDMALRLEKAFGVRMETLIGMQSAYDIARTRARASFIRVRPYAKAS